MNSLRRGTHCPARLVRRRTRPEIDREKSWMWPPRVAGRRADHPARRSVRAAGVVPMLEVVHILAHCAVGPVMRPAQ